LIFDFVEPASLLLSPFRVRGKKAEKSYGKLSVKVELISYLSLRKPKRYELWKTLQHAPSMRNARSTKKMFSSMKRLELHTENCTVLLVS